MQRSIFGIKDSAIDRADRENRADRQSDRRAARARLSIGDRARQTLDSTGCAIGNSSGIGEGIVTGGDIAIRAVVIESLTG